MLKNKIFKIGIITILLVATVILIIFAHFFLTTLSVQDCIDYCLENTKRNATNFVRLGDGRYVADYAYFIAADGDSSKPQEVFVFKEKFLGSITAFDRYEFVMSSTQSDNETEKENKFGSIQFFPRDDNGEKSTRSTLIFFGARKDSDITEYEYTLTVREGSNVYRGRVGKVPKVWYIKFFDLCDTDYNSKKVISDVKFFDSEGNLVGVY